MAKKQCPEGQVKYQGKCISEEEVLMREQMKQEKRRKE